MTPSHPSRTRTKLLGNARLVNPPFTKLLAYPEILRNGLDRLSRARKGQGALAWNEESARKPICFVFDQKENNVLIFERIDWIKTDTPELKAAEAIYSLFDKVNFFLRLAKSKRLVISGGATLASSMLILDVKSR